MRTAEMSERFVVTGLGITSPAGFGVGPYWNGLLNPAKPPTDGQFRVPQITDGQFPGEYQKPKNNRAMDDFTRFALLAAHEAATQSGIIGDIDPRRLGVIVGVGDGGSNTRHQVIHDVYASNPPAFGRRDGKIPLRYIPMTMPSGAASLLGIYFGAEGPIEAPSLACATGGAAVIAALQKLSRGNVDAMIVGSSEATSESPVARAAFVNMGAITRNGISMPFDARRDGFALAEGSGMLVVERESTALKRGATPLAYIIGYGETNDAHNMTDPHPEGKGLERAYIEAMEDAGIEPSQVGALNVHGTSTGANDSVEAEVIARIFGTEPDGPLVTSNKGAFGHWLGGCAAESVASVLSLQHKLIPHIANLEIPDPSLPAINLVMGQPAVWEHGGKGIILKANAAFGGSNIVLAYAAA